MTRLLCRLFGCRCEEKDQEIQRLDSILRALLPGTANVGRPQERRLPIPQDFAANLSLEPKTHTANKSFTYQGDSRWPLQVEVEQPEQPEE